MRMRNDKFMISCIARCGSSMLCTMLDSHPQVLCHGEILAGRYESSGPYHYLIKREFDIAEWLHDYRQARPESFLYDVCFNPAGNKSVGFKFKLEESLDPAYKVFRDLVVADKDIKIIHLQREDILDQYISLQATRQTGVFLVRSRGKRPKLKPFDIDVPDLISYVREARRKQEAAEEMYKDHDCLHLTYEELCESQSAAYQKILSFLEVPHASLSTTMVKVLKKNTDLVLNLDQVNEALARDGSRTMSKL